METAKAPALPLTWSIAETARQLGVGKNSAYAAVKSGELPSIRIGGVSRVPVAAVMRKLEEAGQI